MCLSWAGVKTATLSFFDHDEARDVLQDLFTFELLDQVQFCIIILECLGCHIPMVSVLLYIKHFVACSLNTCLDVV